MIRWILFLVLLTQGVHPMAAIVPLEYTLSMEKPHTHYFNVNMTVRGIRKDYVDIAMPVWAPGSYKVREFAKNVENFAARDVAGALLRTEKITKTIWRVYSLNSDAILISYDVYAFELTVRTSFLDRDHGYINGTSIFMFVKEQPQLASRITINLYKEWKTISTALKHEKDNIYSAENYDELADSPIELGNHQVFSFMALDKPHEVALFGYGNFDTVKMASDMKTIIETSASVVGEVPYQKYLFIIHALPGVSGGLEHLNSTTLGVDSWAFSDEARYKNFLALVAHEHFHVWNVKRIRPFELGPFNYLEENYTNLLWFSEGVTAYYDDLITRRAGFLTDTEYFTRLENNIQELQNSPGRLVRSAEEASRDAWIKYYNPDENSANASVSYYTKGAMLGLLLDVEIMRETKGEKNLNDVMKYLWKEYYRKQKRGFTPAELQKSIEAIAGRKLDTFFTKYISGREELPYAEYLKEIGLDFQQSKSKLPFLGMELSDQMMVRFVTKNSPAYEAGLNVNDEILAVNGYRVNRAGINARIGDTPIGEPVRLTISRAQKLREITLTYSENSVTYRISKLPSASDAQSKLFEKWLKK